MDDMQRFEQAMDEVRRRSALLELLAEQQRFAFEYAKDAAAEPHEVITDHRYNRGA